MSENEDSNEIPVKIKKEESELEDEEENQEEEIQLEEEPQEPSIEELKQLLSEEQLKVTQYEEKLKRTLADFQNLQRKTQTDIKEGIATIFDQFMLDFLQIYDDFTRAKNAFSESGVNTEGLDSILKNMDNLLSRYNITPIESLGEIFDPKFHEAIAFSEDSSLDENTITRFRLFSYYFSYKFLD